MAAQRILIKMSHPAGTAPGLSGFAVGAEPLRKLFDAGPGGAGQTPSLGADGAAMQQAWYMADAAAVSGSFGATGSDHPWDLAHGLVQGGMGAAGGPTVLMAEPDMQQDAFPQPQAGSQSPAGADTRLLAAADPRSPAAQMGFPYVQGPGFAWHLDDSELLGLDGGVGAAVEIGQHFGRAKGLAARQGARSWQVRAAMNLAPVLRDAGDAAGARDQLSAVYETFTEGFASRDLQQAACLLMEL